MSDDLTEEEQAALEAFARGDGDECENDEDEEMVQEGMEMLEERDAGEEALQLDHQLDQGKFHVGASWVHLDGLVGTREQYNGEKFLVVSFGVRHPEKVKVRSPTLMSESGKPVALWVKRINCRATVHKDSGAWKATPNVENTGATGAARWVALGRDHVDEMQGKLKYQRTAEEEAEREQLFALIDVNGNGVLSLAEIDKALPEVMGCVALFNAKPAIIRAFLAASGRPSARQDDAAFREHAKDYITPGEQFRLLLQYLYEFFEMYLIFQDMGDADADRRIDCKEFANFITSGKAERCNIKVTPEMLEDLCGETPMPGYSLFNEIDADQGGCILFKEFSDYCIRKGIKDRDRHAGGEDRQQKMRAMFHSAKDTDDGISLGRFHKMLQQLGMADDDIGEIIRETDKNGNYVIDVDEFVDWLLKGNNKEGTETLLGAETALTGPRGGSSSAAIWQFETRSGFKPFYDDCQPDLEKGYESFKAGGPGQIEITSGGHSMLIDFEQMKQVNEGTGRSRNIARHE